MYGAEVGTDVKVAVAAVIFQKMDSKNYHKSQQEFKSAKLTRNWYCCNLSGSIALIVWFTMNGMCVKNKNICGMNKQE